MKQKSSVVKYIVAKFIFNIYKRFVYKKILNKILTIENENENVFVCNELEKYLFVKKEFLYFKEIISTVFFNRANSIQKR